MYSAPLREKEILPHERERDEWARRLREGQETRTPRPDRNEEKTPRPGLSGDAALAGLILFLLSDHGKSDGILLSILVYLLLSQ